MQLFGNLIIKHWTPTTKDCYKRGCICSGLVLGGVDARISSTFTPCPIYEIYFKGKKQKCQVKRAVLETVRKFGIEKDLEKRNNLED